MPPESAWSHMDPIQEPQPIMDEPHSRLDTPERSISELKDDHVEIAQDVVQRAKEIGKQKAGSEERQEGPRNFTQNSRGRREDGREWKRSILQAGAITSCSNKHEIVSDPPSRLQGGESPQIVVEG